MAEEVPAVSRIHPLLRLAGALIAISLIILLGYFTFVLFVVSFAPNAGAFSLIIFAAVAGVATFFNPCAFPLMPGYLAHQVKVTPGEERRSLGSLLYGGSIAAMGLSTFNLLLGGILAFLGATFLGSLALASAEPNLAVRIFRGVGDPSDSAWSVPCHRKRVELRIPRGHRPAIPVLQRHAFHQGVVRLRFRLQCSRDWMWRAHPGRTLGVRLCLWRLWGHPRRLPGILPHHGEPHDSDLPTANDLGCSPDEATGSIGREDSEDLWDCPDDRRHLHPLLVHLHRPVRRGFLPILGGMEWVLGQVERELDIEESFKVREEWAKTAMSVKGRSPSGRGNSCTKFRTFTRLRNVGRWGNLSPKAIACALIVQRASAPRHLPDGRPDVAFTRQRSPLQIWLKP